MKRLRLPSIVTGKQPVFLAAAPTNIRMKGGITAHKIFRISTMTQSIEKLSQLATVKEINYTEARPGVPTRNRTSIYGLGNHCFIR